jgi:F0F1-type ATP synthase assembly protein I
MEIIFIAVWLILGAIVASMAQKRGRSAIIGLLLGLIFGIFAVIGYAIAGDTQEKKRARQMEDFVAMKRMLKEVE